MGRPRGVVSLNTNSHSLVPISLRFAPIELGIGRAQVTRPARHLASEPGIKDPTLKAKFARDKYRR